MAAGRHLKRLWDERAALARGAAPLILAGVTAAACAALQDGPATPFARPAAETRDAETGLIREADLLGLEAAALEKLLGAPALARREGEGEMRQYALTGCNLLAFFYPGADGAEKVVYLDAAAGKSGAAKPSVDECLAARG